jgi:hypothetical protein
VKIPGAAALALATGCATVSATPRVTTTAGARPVSVERRVVERALEASWLQRGDTLAVTLTEHRRCQLVEHLPAVREERSVRRADAAIYFEYAAAAVLLGLAAFSFARPELFAAPEVDEAGHPRRDPKTGRALGGVLTALGAGALGAGIYDTVRTRDRTRRGEVVALRAGPTGECEGGPQPASLRQVELWLGGFRGHGVTDLDGRVRFLLPGPEFWPEAPEVAAAPAFTGLDDGAAPPRPGPREWRGTLRTGLDRSLSIAVVVPYDATVADPRTGSARTAAR